VKSVVITGASDDLIEIDGDWSEEYNPLATINKGQPWEALIKSDSEGAQLIVVVHYTSAGTWAVGLAPVEGEPFPAGWVHSLTGHDDPDYSARLVLNLPDDAVLSVLRG
jgi:hypothetical protein